MARACRAASQEWPQKTQKDTKKGGGGQVVHPVGEGLQLKFSFLCLFVFFVAILGGEAP
jgi:hypothetical protein